jgi:putative FmdB family regulatory protein
VPIYEYLCQSCSFKFELKQGIKEDPVATCTRCGKTVNRIISPPAIMFKGTGWYITDYSDKLKAPAGESPDSASGPKTETAGGAGSSTPTTPTPATTSASSSSSGGSPKSG